MTFWKPPPPPPPPPPVVCCPPPPAPPPGFISLTYDPDTEVSSSEAFIPANYSDESVSEPSKVVRILPFRRNVFVTSHHAQATDFEEVKWLIKYGTTETWYEKPSNALLKRMKRAELADSEPDELPSSSAKPTEIQTPKVWVSVALTTPTDDAIYECIAGHVNAVGVSYSRTCQQCTNAKSEALEAMDLSYYLVFNSTQAQDLFVPGGSSTGGRQIYKLIKCGSREAAVAEVFYATGLNGWNLVFSCIARASENVEDRGGNFRRVERLWMLADDDDDGKSVRVFY